MSTRIRVSIAGATGYAGQELVRLLARHPQTALTLATASQASSTPRRLPALARVWDGEVVPLDVPALVRDSDVVFLALPEASSAQLAPRLLDAGLRVVDLSGAYRLRDTAARARWYPATGALPDGVAYGLTEFESDAIRAARLLSNPGCYPTASLLALLPLSRANLLVPGADIIIAQGTEGGGHVGWMASMPLVPMIVDAVAPVPVLAAGGFADGRGLVAAQVLGAQGILLGTRFLATVESPLHPNFKQAIVDSDGHDTQLSEIPDIAAGLVWPGAMTRSRRGSGACLC